MSWKAGNCSVHYSAAAACSLWSKASEGFSSFFSTLVKSAAVSFSCECSRELSAPFSLTSSFSGELSLVSFNVSSTSFSGDCALGCGVPSFSIDFCLSGDSFSGDFSFESSALSPVSSMDGVPSLDVALTASFIGESSLAKLPSLSVTVASPDSTAPSVDFATLFSSDVSSDSLLVTSSTVPFTVLSYK